MKKQEMKTEYIANTNKQPLDKHLLAIAYLTQLIYEKLDLNTENNANMKVACYAAGFFHDIGKLDPGFQKWIKEKSKTKNPDENSSHQDLDNAKKEKTWDSLIRHNEISWLLCKLIAQTNNVRGKPCLVKENLSITDLICYGVYWHHEEKIRNDKKSIDGSFFINSLKNDKIWDELLKIFEIFSESIKTSMEIQEIFVNLNKDIEKLDSTMPKFKTLDTQEDINNSLIRACLIEADRKISKLSCNELMKLFNEKSGKIEKEKIEKLLISTEIESSLKNSIEKRIKELEDKKNNKYFDESRNKAQLETANSLAEKLKKGYAILQGPAGVGKTNISLMTAKKQENCKKIIYICPRVQVCQQNYNAIKQELLGVKIQIFTGEFKKECSNGTETAIEEDDFLNADVVVTTIDQIASLFLNHLRSPKLLSLLEKNTLLVFDEFHELSGLPGHYPSFKEIINLKRKINSGCGALFMSATPNPIFLCDALSFNDNNKMMLSSLEDNIVKVASFNEKPIILNFTEEDNISLKPREIKIYNLIRDIQNEYVQNFENESSIVYHSRFTIKDKEFLFNEIIKHFGKESENDSLSLRAGPIIQASLDISTDNLTTQETSPENLLQRIGRCNRWGLSNESNVTVILNKKNKNGNIESNCQKKYLDENYCYNTTLKFSDFIRKENESKPSTTINDLYDLYFKFVSENKQEYLKDLEKFKEEVFSFHEKNEFFKPKQIFNKNKKSQLKKLSKISLRGTSIYVLPAKLFWNTQDRKFEFVKTNNDYDWLWKPGEISQKIEDNKVLDIDTGCFLTISREDYSILNIVDKFKVNIKRSTYQNLYKENSYTKYNLKQVSELARVPETPLLISDPNNEFGYDKKFGYYFEYDKNSSRYKGLGLIDLSEKDNSKKGNSNDKNKKHT